MWCLFLCIDPPQGKQAIFTKVLRDTLKSLSADSKIVLTGDFNIDYSMANCKSVRELRQLEREFVLEQKISVPTRVTNRSTTLIDLIFTNMEDVLETGVLDMKASDHYATYIIVKKKKTAHGLTSFTCRVMGENTLKDVEERLQAFVWEDFMPLVM